MVSSQMNWTVSARTGLSKIWLRSLPFQNDMSRTVLRFSQTYNKFTPVPLRNHTLHSSNSIVYSTDLIRSAAYSLVLLLASALVPIQAADNSVAVEALSRLKGVDLEANPALKTAVLRVVDSTRGTAQFVELVRDFKLKDQEASLLEYALAHSKESAAAEATRLILDQLNQTLLKEGLSHDQGAIVAELLGASNDRRGVPLLDALIGDSTKNLVLRSASVRALARTREGATTLLRRAQKDQLPQELKSVATTELSHVLWPEIQSEAMKVLPPTAGLGGSPLPPVAELMARKGDITHGESMFFSQQVNCSGCHQVNGRGVEFGPRLSEIGAKLGKDALYVAVLDPNAGISFGYETWQIELKNGDEASGLLASETEEDVIIKAGGGISLRYKKSEISRREKLKTSSMPTGLEQAMSTQDLVDLIEFLSSLKKATK